MSISQNFPAIRPTLSLNFARSKTLDPRITFTRASTATYVDREGIIRTAVANQARFDHDLATGESLGLLIEEQRTNLITSSNNFQEGVYWSDPGGRWTSTPGFTSPDGSQNAWKITRTLGDALLRREGISVTSGLPYTFSAYFKLVSGNNLIRLDASDTSPPAQIIYPDRWVRLFYTFTASSSSIYLDIENVFPVGGDEYLIWGAQLEAGSFPTSYIPTSGSAVTRSADLTSISGDSFSKFYNPNGGTAYIDLISNGVNADGAAYQVYFSFNSDGSNRWGISHQNESRGSYAANAVLPYVGQAGVFDVVTRFSKTLVPGSRNKYTMTQPNGSDVKIMATGVQGFTSGITNKTPAINQLYLGHVISDNGNLNGTIAEFRYYPEALTSDQITTLIK